MSDAGEPRLTRRQFLPRAAAAAIGAGALLRAGAGSSDAGATPSMRFRQLGRTGIEVSEIAFGSHVNAANMADPAGRARQIRRGLERGINLFDIYEHNYHQFEPMSRLLRPRQQSVISLVSVWGQGKTMAEVESSLTTFGTDTIDLYRIYAGDDRGMASMENIDERLDALRRAREQGKIRAMGVSAHDQRMMVALLRRHADIDYLMFPYNFRHRRLDPGAEPDAGPPAPAGPDESGLRDCTVVPCPSPEFAAVVRDHRAGLIAMKPFAGGALLRLETADPSLRHLAAAGVSLPQAALRFILQSPRIACAVAAMNSVAEIEENVGALSADGLSDPQGKCLRLYDEAAEKTEGRYLPDRYRWLERYKV